LEVARPIIGRDPKSLPKSVTIGRMRCVGERSDDRHSDNYKEIAKVTTRTVRHGEDEGGHRDVVK
jgi:hypothetical protein